MNKNTIYYTTITPEEAAVSSAEQLNDLKINIAKEKLKYVSSADELTIAIAHFAIEHNVGTVVLSRGIRHSIVGNYAVLECNFIVGDEWYMLTTEECNDIKANGGLHLSTGLADTSLVKFVLPKILKSESFTEKGLFNSGLVRNAVTQRFGLDELGHIADFCKEFIDPVLERNNTWY